MTSLYESVRIGSLTLPKSCLHGAIDPKSRYAKWGARPVGIHVLQPARIGRADCHRGNANLAHGKGLYQHPGHSFGGADRRLEAGRRCGTPGGRANLSSALARGPNLSQQPVAGKRIPGGAFRDQGTRADSH